MYIRLKDINKLVENLGCKIEHKRKTTWNIKGNKIKCYAFQLSNNNLDKIKEACSKYNNIKCFQSWKCNYLPFDQLIWVNKENIIYLK